jgi:hypothetical protein
MWRVMHCGMCCLHLQGVTARHASDREEASSNRGSLSRNISFRYRADNVRPFLGPLVVNILTALGLYLDICLKQVWDSPFGIATGYGLGDRGVGVRVPLLLHVIETGSGAHPASCPMGIGGCFPGGKAAVA